MIIWGWREKQLKQAPFPGHQCQICKAKDAHVVVYGSYFHLFWIPLFPFKKSLKIICAHCGNGATPKNVSKEVRQVAKHLKSKVRQPIWMFSGILIVALLITIGSTIDNSNEEREFEILNAPEVNDIYYFYMPKEPSEHKYEIKKVVRVEGDSIDLAPSAFRYKRKTSKLLPDDGFYDTQTRYHKQQLLDFYNDRIVRGVKRGFLPSSGFNRNIPYSGTLPGE